MIDPRAKSRTVRRMKVRPSEVSLTWNMNYCLLLFPKFMKRVIPFPSLHLSKYLFLIPMTNRALRTHNHTLWQAHTTYLLVASWIALLNACIVALWKRGGNKPLKSAPTRLKDKPKYIHWPSSESKRLPTPRSKSYSKVFKNCWTWRVKRKQHLSRKLRKIRWLFPK